MSNNKKEPGKQIVTRAIIVYFATLIFACAIIVRILTLQIFQHDKWINTNDITQKRIIEANRGDIRATDGRLLATSVPLYRILFDAVCPGITNEVFNTKIDSLAYCLSDLFQDRTKLQYKNLLLHARRNNIRYLFLQKEVNYNTLKKVKKFPIFRRGKYKGGLIVEKVNKRKKPFINLATRTIGYENLNGTAVGLEGAYNKQLKGTNGVRMAQKIAGNYWMPISDDNEIKPKNGNDIITTIDINLQDVATQALKQQLIKHSASHGTAVLMEVKTGDIKAIANLKYNEGIYSEEFNFAIGERTEPGSTFKLPALMVALEDGYVDLNDSIDTGNGTVKYYDHTIRDSRKGGYGKITVKQVFEKSSNVGMAKIITKYYKNNADRFVNRLKRMSLTDVLDIEIQGERKPYIKFPSDTLWSGISLAQMSYGYEVEQTPLQILTFYNAIANNGKMMRPRFVKAIADYSTIIKEIKPHVINPTICSKATIQKAKKMLEGVVENGTAQNLKNSNYKIAGKTGTAQVANKKYGYKYKSKVSYQASFVGYFPADNPKYSCIVVVNAPSSGVYYGNLVAGQVFKEIADKVYSTSIDLQDNTMLANNTFSEIPYSKNGYKNELLSVLKTFNITSDTKDITSDWVVTEKKDSTIKLYNRHIKPGIVPNVKGMGAKDAIFLLENLGLRVALRGRGTVTKQSIQQNARYKNGDKIILTLT